MSTGNDNEEDDQDDDYLRFFLSEELSLSHEFLEEQMHLESVTTFWEIANTTYDDWIFILFDIDLFQQYEQDLKRLRAFTSFAATELITDVDVDSNPIDPISFSHFDSDVFARSSKLRLNRESRPYTQALVTLRNELTDIQDLRSQFTDSQASSQGGGEKKNERDKDGEDDLDSKAGSRTSRGRRKKPREPRDKKDEEPPKDQERRVIFNNEDDDEVSQLEDPLLHTQDARKLAKQMKEQQLRESGRDSGYRRLIDPIDAYDLGLSYKTRIDSHHGISTKITWDGTILKYSEFGDLFVAWLIQNSMGYILHPDFHLAYTRDGLKMLSTYQDDAGLALPLSKEQFKYDRQMIYAALLSCFRKGGVAKEILARFKSTQDGFSCWHEVNAKYDNHGHEDVIRLLATAKLQQPFHCGYSSGLARYILDIEQAFVEANTVMQTPYDDFHMRQTLLDGITKHQDPSFRTLARECERANYCSPPPVNTSVGKPFVTTFWMARSLARRANHSYPVAASMQLPLHPPLPASQPTN